MAEYIDREKLPPKKERGFFLEDDFNAGWNACLDYINSIPAADVVERKTGRWLKVNGYAIALVSDGETITMPTHKCSACGDSSLNVFYTNYCPKCGAKMIGDDEDV